MRNPIAIAVNREGVRELIGKREVVPVRMKATKEVGGNQGNLGRSLEEESGAEVKRYDKFVESVPHVSIDP